MESVWSWAVGAAAVLLLVVLPVLQYNRMTQLRLRCNEAWSNVDTELQRRHELVPNLVAAVQGYAKHEQGVLQAVAEARAKAVAARGPAQLAAEEGRLVASLDRLFLVAEAYPDLKASRNFLHLQEELALTEDRIQAARRFYNGNVRDYRMKVRTFPGVLFAPLFGMRPIAYFELASPAMRTAPSASFAAPLTPGADESAGSASPPAATQAPSAPSSPGPPGPPPGAPTAAPAARTVRP